MSISAEYTCPHCGERLSLTLFSGTTPLSKRTCGLDDCSQPAMYVWRGLLLCVDHGDELLSVKYPPALERLES